MLIGWWLIHPAILRECVLAFNTIRVGDRDYLAADLSVATDDPEFASTRMLATLLAGTFVPMVPLGIFGSLFLRRHELRDDVVAMDITLQRRFFFFFGSFKSAFYYWEAVWGLSKSILVWLLKPPRPQMLGCSFSPQHGSLLRASSLEVKFEPFVLDLENSLGRARRACCCLCFSLPGACRRAEK